MRGCDFHTDAQTHKTKTLFFLKCLLYKNKLFRVCMFVFTCVQAHVCNMHVKS